jgi:predicted glycosyltransferase
MLMRYAAGKKVDVAMGHGSRALPMAARLSGIKNLTMFDYEHVSTWIFRTFCDRILIPRATLSRMKDLEPSARWVPFDGFKEEVYLAEYVVDPSIRIRLGVKPEEVLVALRPPATTAHYHDPKSEDMLRAITARLGSATNVRTVWLRRDLADPIPNLQWVPSFIVPHRPLDGPSLLAEADVAISGGGTMTREAALLGTPAYSIFAGPTGAIDEELSRRGSLVLVRSVEEAQQIPIVKKPSGSDTRAGCTTALREFVLDQIQELARSKGRARVVADEANGKGGALGSSVR